MSKSVVAIALTLIALAFVPAEALAYPISVAEAQRCGHWQTGANGVQICAWCEYGRRRAEHSTQVRARASAKRHSSPVAEAALLSLRTPTIFRSLLANPNWQTR